MTICSKEVVPSGSYHDLVVEMRRNDDQIMGFIDFNTGLFEVSEIDNLMTHFIVMLEALIENIELPIVQSPILPEVEKSQILLGWNNSEQVFTESHSLRILIEGHAANHPEAIALLMGNHELSYGELNLAANKLASYLKSLGIQDNDFVGILMENSFDLVICLLGVMKAGAVVVALEAGYPKERLSYILKDSHRSC